MGWWIKRHLRESSSSGQAAGTSGKFIFKNFEQHSRIINYSSRLVLEMDCWKLPQRMGIGWEVFPQELLLQKIFKKSCGRCHEVKIEVDFGFHRWTWCWRTWSIWKVNGGNSTLEIQANTNCQEPSWILFHTLDRVCFSLHVFLVFGVQPLRVEETLQGRLLQEHQASYFLGSIWETLDSMDRWWAILESFCYLVFAFIVKLNYLLPWWLLSWMVFGYMEMSKFILGVCFHLNYWLFRGVSFHGRNICFPLPSDRNVVQKGQALFMVRHSVIVMCVLS